MKLLAVTNDRLPVRQLAQGICQMNEMVDYIHIREKSKSISDIILLIKLLEQEIDKKKLVIHDRLDLALLYNIPTIHLPSYGLPVKRVRKQYPSLRIGRSVHSLDEAIQAEKDGANYVLYGHLFKTNSKLGQPPRGVAELTKIKRMLHIPVYGIGGITANNLKEIKNTNLDGVAVMSGIFDENNPQEEAAAYYKACREVSRNDDSTEWQKCYSTRASSFD